MESGYADETADEVKRQESQLEIINLHLGTNLGALLEYEPQSAVMDTV